MGAAVFDMLRACLNHAGGAIDIGPGNGRNLTLAPGALVGEAREVLQVLRQAPDHGFEFIRLEEPLADVGFCQAPDMGCGDDLMPFDAQSFRRRREAPCSRRLSASWSPVPVPRKEWRVLGFVQPCTERPPTLSGIHVVSTGIQLACVYVEVASIGANQQFAFVLTERALLLDGVIQENPYEDFRYGTEVPGWDRGHHRAVVVALKRIVCPWWGWLGCAGNAGWEN